MKNSQNYNEEFLKDVALVMTVTCVRNTAIENYHAAGQLSDKEMKAFNIQVANKIYTFLHFYAGSVSLEDQSHFIELAFKDYPINWNRPELEQSTLDAIEISKGTPLGKKMLEKEVRELQEKFKPKSK